MHNRKLLYTFRLYTCDCVCFFLQTCVRDSRAPGVLRFPASYGEFTRFRTRDHGYHMLPSRSLVNHLQKHIRL